ncbi:MAG: right-handed parallel beta-helix repeat-containing protein [Candidatus Thermoplasmatota archaeon]|nr:right-handed parallel beta-helix repeat-containing protein [Candidatus Thermoplasmatota archaeon]
MKNKNLNRCLTYLTAAFMISVVTLSSTGMIFDVKGDMTEKQKTLYVGGSGPGNYSSIQKAINDALDGFIIFVYKESSPYKENVVIDKTIQLLGESKYSTIIDGGEKEDVIRITADKVTVSGFTLKNSRKDYLDDAGVDLRSSYNIIKDNIIDTNNQGMNLEYYSNYNTIQGNQIIASMMYGIHIASNVYQQIGSSYNNIIGNEILKNNIDGVDCFYGYSNYNKFSENLFQDNDRYSIGLKGSCIKNEIIENKFVGGHIAIELYACPDNSISKNDFYDCTGIALHQYSPGNKITNNRFFNSTIEIGSPELIIIENWFEKNAIVFQAIGTLDVWNTHIIKDNLASGKPIRYYKNINHVTVPENTGQVILANCKKSEIQGLSLKDIDHGIQIGFSEGTIIEGNCADKIRVYESSRTTISKNTIIGYNPNSGWDDGIYLRYSPDSKIIVNKFVAEGQIELFYSPSCSLEKNEFTDEGRFAIFDSPSCTINENSLNYGGCINLYWDSDNSVVKNNVVAAKNKDFSAIFLQGPSNVTISYNSVVGNNKGISLINSDGNTIYRNILKDNDWGIFEISSDDNTIFENVIEGCSVMGLKLYGDNSRIYHNNFINNSEHAYGSSPNIFDDGYPSGGNYWDDYDGEDYYQGPGQNITGSDGIGDIPYYIPGGPNRDNYPLMDPYDLNPPTIEFQIKERYIEVKLGNGIGGPGDERLDVSANDDTTPQYELNLTLYVKGFSETDWSLIKTMPYIRELHRGSIIDKEIKNFYDNGFDLLLYKIVAVDNNGNIAERPSSNENPLKYMIKILDK